MPRAESKTSTWKTIQDGWSLLSKRERKLTTTFSVAITFLSLIDTLALGATLPLITLILEADKVYANDIFNMVWTFMGSPELEDVPRDRDGAASSGSTPTDTAVQRDNKRSNYSNNTSIPSTTQTNKNPKKQLSFKGLCFGCGDRI